MKTSLGIGALLLLLAAPLLAQTPVDIVRMSVDPTASGSGVIAALNDEVVLTLDGEGAVGFQLVGTCTSGAVAFETSVDGTNYAALQVFPANSQTGVASATAAGVWSAQIGPATKVRMRVSDACDANNFTGTMIAQGLGGRLFSGDQVAAILNAVISGSEIQADVVTSALPTGASTLAEQQTQTTSLQKIDNVAHSGSDVALSEHVPISGQLDDTATTTVTENQLAPLRITPFRAFHVNLRTAAGNELATNVSTADANTLRVVAASDFSAPMNFNQVNATTIEDPFDVDSGAGISRVLGVSWRKAASGGSVEYGTTTNPVNVADAGGSLTVDAPVGTPVNVQIGDGTETATVTPGGRLQVETASKASDDQTFAVATDDGYPFFALADEVTPDSVDEGDAGIVRMSPNRNLYAQIRDVTAERSATVRDTGTNDSLNVAIVDAAGNHALPSGSNNIGDVDVASIAAGDNNIGNVDVVTLPSLPAGTNNIGDVDVLSFPDNEPFNVAQMNGVAVTMGNGVSGTGVQRVTIASDSTGQVALATGSNTIGALTANQSVNVAQMNGVATTMGNGVSGTGVQRVTIASDSTGQVALAAGSALVGQISPVATATTTNTAVWHYTASAASTNATSVKGSAGNVYGINVINTTATVYYLRMYNTAAAPTCSSATGFVASIPVPAATSGAGFVNPIAVGVGFGTGIGFCLTGGAGSTDNTNAAVGLFINIFYK